MPSSDLQTRVSVALLDARIAVGCVRASGYGWCAMSCFRFPR